jgi:predicted ATP-dependent serine protease
MYYMALTKTDYTMRCKNCGWENPNGLTKCEKCNTPVAGAVNNEPAYGTVPEASQAVQNLNKTIFEAEVFPQAAPAANACLRLSYAPRRDRLP